MHCTQKGSDASPGCKMRQEWLSIDSGVCATHQVLCARPSGHDAEEDVPTRGGLVHPYLPAKCRQSQWNKRNKGRKKLAQQVSKSVANANKKTKQETRDSLGDTSRDRKNGKGQAPATRVHTMCTRPT